MRAERRAWLIIWLAFATFCALIFAGFKFTLEYVSTANVDQTAVVTGTRGQVVLSLPGSSEKTLLGARSDLAVGTVLWVDRTTSAELQLFDDTNVKLLGGSTLALTRMEVGRFINQHAVVLTQTSGPVQYATAEEPLNVQLDAAMVQLAAHGDYTVWLDGDNTRIMVYAGEARVTPNNAMAISVPQSHRLEMSAGGQPVVADRLQVPLLGFTDFSQHERGWQAIDVTSNQDVNGVRSWVSGPDDNTVALRMTRQSVKQEHGETGLAQPLDVNVSGFRHLWLQAWVRVDYANLSGGGTFGFEYPTMFRIKYEGPAEGSYIPWSVGMYYANPENRTIPQNTAVLWPQGEWKLYRQDLMDADASNMPYRLLEFAVMAQGHSYDASVAGISLTGE